MIKSAGVKVITYTPADREMLQAEFTALVAEVAVIKDATVFNNKVLLNGGSDFMKYYINRTAAVCFDPSKFDVNNVEGQLQGLSILTVVGAEAAIPAIEQAILDISAFRSNAGANQNRLEREVSLYEMVQQNVSALRSGGPVLFNTFTRSFAEGGISNVQSALQRMRELAVQASNEVMSDPDRLSLQKENIELLRFIDLANSVLKVNGKTLVSGESVFKDICFAGNVFDIRIASLGLAGIDLSTRDGAISAYNKIQTALSAITVMQVHFAEIEIARMVADYAIQGASFPVGWEVYDILRKQYENATSRISQSLQDLASMSQTEEGYAAEINGLLQRMIEIAIQAANVTNTQTDRDNIDAEFDQLVLEIRRIETTATFNGRNLFNPSDGGYLITMQPPASDLFTYDTSSYNFAPVTEGLESFDLTTQAGAEDAIVGLGDVIDMLNAQRTILGEQINSLGNMANSIGSTCWLPDWWLQVGGTETPCNMVVTKAPVYNNAYYLDDYFIQLLLPEIDRVAHTYSDDFTSAALGLTGVSMLDLAGIVDVQSKLSPTLVPSYMYMVDRLTTEQKCYYGIFAPGDGEICG